MPGRDSMLEGAYILEKERHDATMSRYGCDISGQYKSTPEGPGAELT